VLQYKFELPAGECTLALAWVLYKEREYKGLPPTNTLSACLLLLYKEGEYKGLWLLRSIRALPATVVAGRPLYFVAAAATNALFGCY
jgi:hypothetical protein